MDGTPKFQFHIGSIKKGGQNYQRFYFFKFQFHIGSIKKQNPSRQTQAEQVCFNSTLVQLKS